MPYRWAKPAHKHGVEWASYIQCPLPPSTGSMNCFYRDRTKRQRSGFCSQVLRSLCGWSAGIESVEKSIEEAYEFCIESAKHYIYIEVCVCVCEREREAWGNFYRQVCDIRSMTACKSYYCGTLKRDLQAFQTLAPHCGISVWIQFHKNQIFKVFCEIMVENLSISLR